ncbi:MAG: CHAT domain-containing protein [Planctomycetota bacterium]|jgi:CHAT domain-containing protein
MIASARRSRLLALVLTFLLAASILATFATPFDAQSKQGITESTATSADAYNELIRRFLTILGTLRAGDVSAKPALIEVANELCDHHNRCDTLDVARYYDALESDELQRGLAFENRYRELFGAVTAARRAGLVDDEWLTERARILGQLATLASESGADADHAPAGRALSLSALLRADSLERRVRVNSLAYQHELSAGHSEVTRSLSILRAAGHQSPQLEALWVQGRLHRLSNRRASANASFEQCVLQATRIGNDGYAVRGLVELLRLAREAGDTRVREELLEQLSEISSPETCWPLVREYADWMFQDDHAAEAQALLMRYPPSSEVDAADWHVYVGNTALRAGDSALAKEHLEWLEVHEQSSRAMLAHAQLLLAEGRPEDVIRDLGDGVLEIDFKPHAEAVGRSLLGESMTQIGDWRTASAQFRRALGIAELYRSQLLDSDHNVFGEWIGLHTVTLAAETESRLGNPLEAARIIENYQSRSLRDRRAESNNQKAATLSHEDLLNWADAYELGVVTWAIGADFGMVAHVSPSSSELTAAWAGRIPHGRRTIRQAARRLRESVLDNRQSEIESLADEIATALFPSALRHRLKSLASVSASPRLLLLTHGPIETIPLELLVQAGRTFGYQIVPVRMPGLPDSKPNGAAPNFAALDDWILASASEANNLPALPAAESEVQQLSELLGGARRLAGDKQLIDFERSLELGHPLHVATHMTWGCNCTDSRLAPLVLQLGKNEAICAHRIAELQPKAPLVVLSACETAAGRFVDAEGLQGLTRAFLESGTRNLLVTGWPVADRAAESFVLDFHRALLAGELPSVAAQHAREAAKTSGSPAADWAAFRLIGID